MFTEFSNLVRKIYNQTFQADTNDKALIWKVRWYKPQSLNVSSLIKFVTSNETVSLTAHKMVNQRHHKLRWTAILSYSESSLHCRHVAIMLSALQSSYYCRAHTRAASSSNMPHILSMDCSHFYPQVTGTQV